MAAGRARCRRALPVLPELHDLLGACRRPAEDEGLGEARAMAAGIPHPLDLDHGLDCYVDRATLPKHLQGCALNHDGAAHHLAHHPAPPCLAAVPQSGWRPGWRQTATRQPAA